MDICDYRNVLSSVFAKVAIENFAEAANYCDMKDLHREQRRWLAEQLDAQGRGARSKLAAHLRVRPDAITRMTNLGGRGEGREISGPELALMAEFFKATPPGFIMPRSPPASSQRFVKQKPGFIPLVGYVGAGAATHFMPAGQLGEVDDPGGSTPQTVAVEIRGDSLGPLFDRWLVFYDDVRRPVTADLVGRLCVVGLDDGRVLIKKVQRSKNKRGLFNLVSQTEEPINDVPVEWAAVVKNMVPR